MKNYITAQQAERIDAFHKRSLITQKEYEYLRDEYYTREGVKNDIWKTHSYMGKAHSELSCILWLTGLSERIKQTEGGADTAKEMQALAEKIEKVRIKAYECYDELAAIYDKYDNVITR